MTNLYVELKNKRQKEVNEFPMFFAFSNDQFKEGMEKLGLKEKDTDKIYSLSGTGGYYLKTDSKALKDMFDRHENEMKTAIENDSTGDGFIFDMFLYELQNHEYCYTGSITDTLEALGLTVEEVKASKQLLHGLNKAKNIARYED